MSCEDIRGAVDLGDGLCRIEGGPYSGYTVLGEEIGGHRIGEIVAGPDGNTHNPYVGTDLTNCSSGVGGIVMPEHLSGSELQRLEAEYPGRVALSNGEGTEAAGEACFYLSQPTRERQFINRLWDASSRAPTPYCVGLFRQRANESCETFVTTLCDGFVGMHARANIPQACESMSPTAVEESGQGWELLVGTGIAAVIFHYVTKFLLAAQPIERILTGAARLFGLPLSSNAVGTTGSTTTAATATSAETLAASQGRSVVPRLLQGAANLLTRAAGFLSTPILVITPECGENSDPLWCSGGSGPNA